MNEPLAIRRFRRDYPQAARAVENAGWAIGTRASGHLVFSGPRGELVIGSSTPSDHRAMKNLLADLRRNGLEIGRG